MGYFGWVWSRTISFFILASPFEPQPQDLFLGSHIELLWVRFIRDSSWKELFLERWWIYTHSICGVLERGCNEMVEKFHLNPSFSWEWKVFMVNRDVCSLVGLLGSAEQSLRDRWVMFGLLLVLTFLHGPQVYSYVIEGPCFKLSTFKELYFLYPLVLFHSLLINPLL